MDKIIPCENHQAEFNKYTFMEMHESDDNTRMFLCTGGKQDIFRFELKAKKEKIYQFKVKT